MQCRSLGTNIMNLYAAVGQFLPADSVSSYIYVYLHKSPRDVTWPKVQRNPTSFPNVIETADTFIGGKTEASECFSVFPVGGWVGESGL